MRHPVCVSNTYSGFSDPQQSSYRDVCFHFSFLFPPSRSKLLLFPYIAEILKVCTLLGTVQVSVVALAAPLARTWSKPPPAYRRAAQPTDADAAFFSPCLLPHDFPATVTALGVLTWCASCVPPVSPCTTRLRSPHLLYETHPGHYLAIPDLTAAWALHHHPCCPWYHTSAAPKTALLRCLPCIWAASASGARRNQQGKIVVICFPLFNPRGLPDHPGVQIPYHLTVQPVYVLKSPKALSGSNSKEKSD